MLGSLELLRIAEAVDRGAADRRQEHLEIGTIDQLRIHAAGLLVQTVPQSVFVDAEALGDARQIPDRIDRRLDHADAAGLADDLAIDRDAAGDDGLADFRHVDVGAGDRDRRTDVVAAREIVAEFLADQMSPRIERDDLLGVRPLRIGPDVRCRRGVGEVGKLVGLERLRRDGERAVDRIAAGVGADRIAMAWIAQRRDHRAALGGGRRAPHDPRRLHHAFDWRCFRRTKQLHIHCNTLTHISPVNSGAFVSLLKRARFQFRWIGKNNQNNRTEVFMQDFFAEVLFVAMTLADGCMTLSSPPQ